MRKAIAAFLLSIVLLSNTQLYQLRNIPALISHYLEHSRTDGTSLIAFLHGHYGHNTKDNDWQDDMKLPFKNAAEISIGVFAFTPSQAEWRANPIIFSPQSQPKLSPTDSFIYQSVLQDIFQPPRV